MLLRTKLNINFVVVEDGLNLWVALEKVIKNKSNLSMFYFRIQQTVFRLPALSILTKISVQTGIISIEI